MFTFPPRLRGILLLAFLVCITNAALAAEEAMLSIRAPAATRLVTSVTYFENGQPTRASVQSLMADDETEWKLGTVDGLEVQIATALPVDVGVELTVGDKVVSASTAAGGRNVRLRFGVIAADWHSSDLDVHVNAVDKAVWQRWQELLVEGDLRSFQIAQASVPDAADAVTFDLPCLRSFLSAVESYLGPPIAKKTNPGTQAVAWDVGGQRVVSSTISFEQGEVTFELAHLGNAITEIKFETDKLDDLWFTGPSEQKPYAATAGHLLSDLFSGDAESAWSRFGTVYRNTVSVEQLRELSQSLTSRFGKMDSVETKFTRLLPIDYDRYQQTLVVVSKVSAGQQQCLAEVKFVFDVAPNHVPSGLLASVFVRPTWKTAQPSHQNAAEFLFETVANGGEIALAESASGQVDAPQQAERLVAIGEIIGPGAETDWDLWRSSGTEEYTRADGTVSLANGQSVDVRLDYVDTEISAITVVTPRRAVSTLDCVQRPKEFIAFAERFWAALLGDDVENAHKLMSSDLQAAQTADSLQFTVATSGFVTANEVGQSYSRLSTEPDRKRRSEISVYSVATLEDGTQHPLRCDLSRNGDRLEIVSFETEVDAAFPVTPTLDSKELVQSFVSGDLESIVALVADQQRIELDREVLARFLVKLNAELGGWQVDPQMRLLHRYSGGSRFETLSGRLTLDDREVPFEVQTRLGKLQAFSFQHDELKQFLSPEFLEVSLRNRATVFVRAWFSTPAQRDDLLRQVLDHELSQEAALDEFGSLRQYLLRRCGALEAVAVDSVLADSDNQTATLICSIDAASQDYRIELTFTWNATSLRISAVEVVR